MRKWRSASRSAFFFKALSACALAAVGSFLCAGAATAGPLDEVAGTVQEATAPVKEVVEAVVPPAPAPPPSTQPPARTPEVKLPELKLPEVKAPPIGIPDAPVNAGAKPSAPTPDALPSAATVVESAKSTVEAVGETVTKATGRTTAAGAGAEEAQGTAGDAAATVQEIAGGGATKDPREQDPAQPGAAAATPSVGDPASETRGGPRATPKAMQEGDFELLASLPARLLNPFVRVWPAMALLAKGPLNDFLGGSSLLTLLEEAGGAVEGSAAADLGGQSGEAVGLRPAATTASPSPLSFNWIPHDNAVMTMVLFVFLALASLAVVVLMRREVGEPVLPRRLTRWRH
jgi:hypothetical protein